MRQLEMVTTARRQRRQRRLFIALIFAFMIHLCAVFTGEWALLLFSTPSDQNRVLTLSLETITEEGVHRSQEVAQDTANDVPIRKDAEQAATQTGHTRADESVPPKTPKRTPAANQAQPVAAEQENAVQKEPIQPNATEETATFALEPYAPLKFNGTHTSANQVTDITSLPVFEYITGTASNDFLLPVSHASLAQHTPANQSQAQPPTSQALDPEALNHIKQKIEPHLAALSLTSTSVAEQESPQTLEWQHDGIAYQAKIRHTPSPNDMSTDQVAVEVSTQLDGKKLTTTLEYRQLAFSNFAQFVHQWDEYVSMHDDKLNGRFHSNSSFLISASKRVHPVFTDTVTTASRRVEFDGHRRAKMSEIFQGGLETGVRRIKMPNPKLLFEQAIMSSKHTVALNSSGRLIFTQDGCYLWQPFDQVSPMQKHKLGSHSTYFLAAPKARIYLSGTVNGMVAVYAPKEILIEGNLRYKSREPLDQGGDFLGLISSRNITIANSNFVIDGDLHIDAALYANNRIRVTNLHKKRTGTLSIYGSVSSRSMTATEPRFATQIDFDPRLTNTRPPGFPVTDRYESVAENNAWNTEAPVFIEEPLDDDIEPAVLTN